MCWLLPACLARTEHGRKNHDSANENELFHAITINVLCGSMWHMHITCRIGTRADAFLDASRCRDESRHGTQKCVPATSIFIALPAMSHQLIQQRNGLGLRFRRTNG